MLVDGWMIRKSQCQTASKDANSAQIEDMLLPDNVCLVIDEMLKRW